MSAIITYYATPSQDKLIEQLTDHRGEWFNPSDDFYIMTEPDEHTITVMCELGIDFEVVKGEVTVSITKTFGTDIDE